MFISYVHAEVEPPNHAGPKAPPSTAVFLNMFGACILGSDRLTKASGASQVSWQEHHQGCRTLLPGHVRGRFHGYMNVSSLDEAIVPFHLSQFSRFFAQGGTPLDSRQMSRDDPWRILGLGQSGPRLRGRAAVRCRAAGRGGAPSAPPRRGEHLADAKAPETPAPQPFSEAWICDTGSARYMNPQRTF